MRYWGFIFDVRENIEKLLAGLALLIIEVFTKRFGCEQDDIQDVKIGLSWF